MASIEAWSRKQVAAYLRSEGIRPMYVQLLKDLDVAGPVLVQLGDADLEEMGIQNAADRAELLGKVQRARDLNLLVHSTKGKTGGGGQLGAGPGETPAGGLSPRQARMRKSYKKAFSTMTDDGVLVLPAATKHPAGVGAAVPQPNVQLTDADARALSDELAERTANSLAGWNDAVQNLLTMFPEMPRLDAEEALRSCEGRVEDAVDMLLAAQFANKTSGDPPASQRSRAAPTGFPADYVPPYAAAGPLAVPQPARVRSFSPAMREEHRSLPWYHGDLDAGVANELLIIFGRTEGLFLMRDSAKQPGNCVLSMVAEGAVIHHLVFATEDGYELFGMLFPTLSDMVAFLFQPHPGDGWRVALSSPVDKSASEGMERPLARTNSVYSFESMGLMTGAQGPPTQDFGNPLFNGQQFNAAPAVASPQSGLAAAPLTRDHFQLQEEEIPYDGDKQFDVLLHDNPEIEQIGLFPGSAEKHDVKLRVTETTVQFMNAEGRVAGEAPFGTIEMLDANDTVLRMIISDSLAGVWYFDSVQAIQIQAAIEGNRKRHVLMEDHRIAQLMQDEEFLTRLAQDPEFAQALEAEAASESPVDQLHNRKVQDRLGVPAPGQNEELAHRVQNLKSGKARSALSRFAKKFRSKKKRHGGGGPRAGAAGPPPMPAPYSASSAVRPTAELPVEQPTAWGSETADNAPAPDTVSISESVYSESGHGIRVRALVERGHSPYDSTALTYQVGDVIRVSKKGRTGQWEGVNESTGVEGCFPFSEVAPLEGHSLAGEAISPVIEEDPDEPPPFDAPSAPWEEGRDAELQHVHALPGIIDGSISVPSTASSEVPGSDGHISPDHVTVELPGRAMQPAAWDQEPDLMN